MLVPPWCCKHWGETLFLFQHCVASVSQCQCQFDIMNRIWLVEERLFLMTLTMLAASASYCELSFSVLLACYCICTYQGLNYRLASIQWMLTMFFYKMKHVLHFSVQFLHVHVLWSSVFCLQWNYQVKMEQVTGLVLNLKQMKRLD